MESNEFDDLMASARQAGQILKTVFDDLTGEEFDLETALKHYPLVILGMAVGAGAIAGLFIGRRHRPILPPTSVTPSTPPANALEFLEEIFPAVEKVRHMVPETMADEAAAMAKNWMDTVLEPKLRQGLDNMAASMADTRLGAVLKVAADKIDPQEDVQLEDPSEDLER